jgi:bacillithiol biosynthesis deacetylase BshB1
MKKKILAFSPHPDDAEFGCGSILIKGVLKGDKVYVVHLSKGEAGSFGTSHTREKESRKAAGIIGAKVGFLNLGGDCNIEYTIKNRLKIAEKIRELQPDIVLSPHTGEDQHPDHYITGKLVRDACRLAYYGKVKQLKKLPVHKVKALFYYSITNLLSDSPEIVVDISEVVQIWEKVMKCYKSQLSKKNYLELQKSKARYLGLLSGVEYAAGLWASAPVLLDSIGEIHNSLRNF